MLYLPSHPTIVQPIEHGSWSRLTSGSSLSWEEVGASEVRISPTSILPLERWYTFRGREEILAFLEVNQFLPGLLSDLYPKIRLHFPDARIFLKVFFDPEGAEGDKLLAVIAVTGQEADEVIDRLHQLNHDGWISILRKAQGKLGITLEFP
jgi:hypothetical protein